MSQNPLITVPDRRLIVITGSSGVGKSTLARALQEQLLPEHWLHFSVDTLFYCLPRSVIQKVDRDNDHSAVDAKAIVAATYACIRTLLGLGSKLILDAVILSEKGADELREACADFDPLFVDLTCALDEIKRRTRARGDRTMAEAEHGYRLAAGQLLAHHTLDTTSMSAEVAARWLTTKLREARESQGLIRDA